MRNFDRLLIDAHPIMYRMAYSIGTKGDPAWGLPVVGGFLDFVRNLGFKYKPRGVYLVWDSGTKSARRRKVYPEYKAERADDPDRQVNQEGIRRATQVLVPLLRRLSCHVFSIPGKEADDVIARIVQQMPHCVVVSEDKDFYQLLPWGIFIFHPMKERLVSAHEFDDEKSQVGISQYLLWKALVGDASDGIKGVHGIGPVLASRLLNSRPSVTSVQQLRESVQAGVRVKGFGKAKARNLQEGWRTLERNVELMDLRLEEFSEIEDLAIQKTLARYRAFDPTVQQTLSDMGLVRFAGSFPEWSLPFQNLGIGGD